KKNMSRLGGKGGLSLEAFANVKNRNQNYNPAVIKKQREFYKNAKFVRKYKRSLHEQDRSNGSSAQSRSSEIGFNSKPKQIQHGNGSLREAYLKKKEEDKKLEMEREAKFRAKTEAKQRSEDRRKASREKMLKKTKSGQPVMKYRIQHILETLQ
ncbi:hypothetical protein M569_08821, partial [Genlisea aurea]